MEDVELSSGPACCWTAVHRLPRLSGRYSNFSEVQDTEILEHHVRFFRGTLGPQFIFVDHNARPQGWVGRGITWSRRYSEDWVASQISRSEFHRACLGCFWWSNCSSSFLSRKPPKAKNCLNGGVDLLPQDLIKNLVNNMRIYCETWISIRGDLTHIKPFTSAILVLYFWTIFLWRPIITDLEFVPLLYCSYHFRHTVMYFHMKFLSI